MSRPVIKVDYTSRDYTAIKADLVKVVQQQLREIYPNLQWDAEDPSDFGVTLLELFAYMGDIMSYYIDRAANETLIDTAIQKSTLYNFSQIYGYRPSGPTQAEVTLQFTNNSASTISLPTGTQCVSQLSYGDVSTVYFETLSDITNLAVGDSVLVSAIEGKTSNTDVAGGISTTTLLPIPVLLVDTTGSAVSSGLPNQERIIQDTGVVDGSVKVYVGQSTSFRGWRFIDNLIEAGPLDQVYTTRLNANGTTSIVFGDGVNGEIPPSGHTISALYKTSAGYAGNVDAGAISEVSYIPGSTLETFYVAVTNPTAAYGGSDADDITQIKKKLKKAILSRRRAVTLEDFEALASTVSGVGRVKASAIDSRSVLLYVQSKDDGTISPGWLIDDSVPTASWDTLRDNILAYMSDKISIGTSLEVDHPVYVDLQLNVAVTAQSSYKNSDVQKAVINALTDPSIGWFSYDTYEFGATVSIADVIIKISSVPGVKSVSIPSILDLFSAVSPTVKDVVLAANELPRLLQANLTVTVTGGIS